MPVTVIAASTRTTEAVMIAFSLRYALFFPPVLFLLITLILSLFPVFQA